MSKCLKVIDEFIFGIYEVNEGLVYFVISVFKCLRN